MAGPKVYLEPVKCQRCGVVCSRASPIHRYCGECRRLVSNEASRDYKRKTRAAIRANRAPARLTCKICGLSVPRRGTGQKYCAPCRRQHDLEASRANVKKWHAANPAYKVIAARQQRERKLKHPKYAISARISRSIHLALGVKKAGHSWESFVDYSLDDLMLHLERQFARGMSWANRGKWHIDHIRPISSFSFDDHTHPDFRACWALSNLRPLWKSDNMKKGSTITLLL